MANYSTLKAAVANVVKTNGTKAITGANLQSVLLSIINSVGGGGYIFKGVATPSTSAGTPDQNVFYVGGAGTYANFGSSYTVPVGSIGVFKYSGSWVKEQIKMFDGIDDVPTAGSDNLVKSGGIYNGFKKIDREIGTSVTETYETQTTGNITINLAFPVYNGDVLYMAVTDINNAYSYYNVYGIKPSGPPTNIGVIGASKTPITIHIADDYAYVRLYSSSNTGRGGVISVLAELSGTIEARLSNLQNSQTEQGEEIDENTNNISLINFNLIGVDGVANYTATQGQSIPIVNGLYVPASIPSGVLFSVLLEDSTGVINSATYTCYGYKKDGTRVSINSYDTQYGGLMPNRLSEYICDFDITAIGVSITGSAVVRSGDVSLIVKAAGNISGKIETLEDKDAQIEDEISALRDDIGKSNFVTDGSLSARLFLMDNASYYFSIPSSLTSYNVDNFLDQRIKNTPFNRKFIFFTDTHQQGTQNCHISSVIEYVKKRLYVPITIFGGDIIDAYAGQYEALANVGNFVSEYFAASGKGLLLVEGNHDANSPGHGDNISVGNNFLIDDYYGYLRTYRNMFDIVHFYDDAYTYASDFLQDSDITAFINSYVSAYGLFYSNDYSGEPFTGEYVRSLFYAWCKKSYYYDDYGTKVRYIVLETRDYGIMARMLSYTATYILADFVESALKTMPSGFSCVVVGHQWGAENGSSPLRRVNDDLPNLVYQLLLAYQSNGSFTYSPFLTTYWLGAKWWEAKYGSTTSKTYNFAGVNVADKIFVLGGHYHIDAAFKVYHSSGTTLAATELSNGSSVGNNEILVVWTQKATYNASVPNMEDYGLDYATYAPMENGTTTEYAFDVVSLLNDRVSFTRFGAGDDRYYLL